MSPIDKISDIRRLPRLGKIKLGIKKEGRGTTYPQAVDYFVCPEELKAVHGQTPRELPVMFPSDDLELIAPQYYKCYSYTHGLICRGDGKTCRRKIDPDTDTFANKDTREWELTDGICEPAHCPMIGTKQCRRMMSLRFILPEVPGLGVYQLDTSSRDSIININSQLAPDAFLRQFTRGRIAFVPLILSVEPVVKNPPGEGRKTVYVLNIRCEVKLADIIRISRKSPAQVLLPTLEEEEPPEDLYPEEVLAEAEGIQEEESSSEGDEKTSEVAKTQAAKQETSPAAEEKPPDEAIEGEGLHIDMTWLKESLNELKWSDDTAKTFLVSQYKVSPSGTLEDVIKKLTRDQADEFVKEIQDRVSQKQMQLFT
jgi:hypothetical protein